MELSDLLAGQFGAVGLEGDERLATHLQGSPEASQQLGLGRTRNAQVQFRPHRAIVVVLQLDALDQQGRLVTPLKIVAEIEGLGATESPHPIGRCHGVSAKKTTR